MAYPDTVTDKCISVLRLKRALYFKGGIIHKKHLLKKRQGTKGHGATAYY